MIVQGHLGSTGFKGIDLFLPGSLKICWWMLILLASELDSQKEPWKLVGVTFSYVYNVYTYIYIHVCVCLRACVCLCVYICIHNIYMHIPVLILTLLVAAGWCQYDSFNEKTCCQLGRRLLQAFSARLRRHLGTSGCSQTSSMGSSARVPIKTL